MTTGVGAFLFALPDPTPDRREPFDGPADVTEFVGWRDRFVSISDPLEVDGPIAPPISDLFLDARSLLFDLRFVLAAGCPAVIPNAPERSTVEDVDGCLVVICLPIRERKLFELVNSFRLLVTPDRVETEFEGCLGVI
ncbi:MAG: hypothetical protein JXM79_02965 [Sedimentisphaerales bacterium]|nr:hypothetical protein [Sedimentisphaerales bacterium]